MSTEIRKKRSSQEYAQKIFEKLYHNETVRTACARLLADSILLAHSISPSCWTLTLFPNKVRLNVGPVEVLVLRSDDIFLVIADSEDGRFSNREYRNYIKPPVLHYTSVPILQRLCDIPPEFIEKIYPQISENHRKYIQVAANRKKVTTWKSSFSIGLILYLQSLLKVTLPIPAYVPSLVSGQNLYLEPIYTETIDPHLEEKESKGSHKPKEFTSQYRWEDELLNWIDSSRNIEKNLAGSFIRFFTLVFENTSCQKRAWFGIHNSQISLVVGNIFLAAIIKTGKDKGIWLLQKNPPAMDYWQSWNTRSTRTSPEPLKWFHTSHFEQVVEILDNPHIWESYRTASSQILNFPTVASDRDSIQKRRGKLRLSEIYAPSIDPLEEIEKYRSSYENLQDTVRRAVIQSRIGQGKFRTDLIAYWGRCAITGCQKVEILRASHIKPWSEASNRERLDVYNGLLLVPNLDVAFDAGYISFDDDGKIMISCYLTEDDQNRLGIHSKLRLSRFAEQHIKYMQYHRKYRYKG